MLPAIVATLCLYLAKRPADAPVPTVVAVPTPPPPKPQKPIKVVTRKPSTFIYQPAPEPVSAEHQLASKFMHLYLTQPHIQNVQQFDGVLGNEGRSQAYQNRFTTAAGNRLWQICAIDTQYGHVYLSLMLNDDFSIPLDTAGVLVTYDNAAVEQALIHTVYQQQQRFGRAVFEYTTVISHEDQLRFLLGDSHHPHSANTHLEESSQPQ